MMSRRQRLGLWLSMLMFWSLPALAQTTDEAALRQLAEQYVRFYAQRDVTALMQLWSAQSPHVTQFKKDRIAYFQEEEYQFTNVTFSRVKVEGDRASLRYRARLKVITVKDRQESESLVIRRISFVREQGAWKIWQVELAANELAASLVAAPDEAARERLLQADAELVNVELVDSLAMIGLDHYNKYELPQAVKVIVLVTQFAERIHHKDRQATALGLLGQCYLRQTEHSQAMESWTKALAIHRETQNRNGEAQMLRALGDLYASQNTYVQALTHYHLARAIQVEIDDKAGLAETLLYIGRIHDNKGELRLAEDYYLQSIRLAEAIDNRLFQTSGLSFLGLLKVNERRFAQSFNYFNRVQKIYKDLQNEVEEAQIINLLGLAYYMQGNHTQSLTNYHQALKILETKPREINQIYGLLGAYTGLANGYEMQGSFELALFYLQQKMKLVESTANDKEEIASCLSSMGSLYAKQKNFPLALEYTNRAIGILRSIQFPIREAEALNGLGYIYFEQGNLSGALRCTQEALTIFQTHGSKFSEINCLGTISSFFSVQGKHQEGLNAALEGIKIAKEIGRLDPHIFTVAGTSYTNLNQPAKAEEYYREAIKLQEIIFSNLAGNEDDSRQYINNNQTAYQRLAELLLAQQRSAAAFEVIEQMRNLALQDTLRRERGSLTKTLTPEERQREEQLTAEYVALNTRYYQLLAQPKPDQKQLDALKPAVEQARAAYQAYRAQLYSLHPQLRAQRAEAPPLTLPETAALLPDAQTALLEYVTLEDQTLLFVVTKGANAPQLATFTLPVKREEWLTQTNTWEKLMLQRDPDYVRASRALYDALLKPAQAVLTGKTKLVIVPDGPLWEVPFQALQTPRNRFLLEDANISYAISLTALRDGRQLRRPAASPSLFALGIGNFNQETHAQQRAQMMGEGLLPLVEVAPMTTAISRFYAPRQRQTLLDAQATEENFKANASRFGILQLSTHGVLNRRNPMYSYIVLAPPAPESKEDGFLEAREIMQMELRADLAILAACETGRGGIGNGEAVIGLKWAFVVAGVPNTIVSQWSVNSAATKELMIELHRQLTTKPQQPKAEALRQAALKLLRRDGFSHPYYWAGFILVGDDK